MDQDLFPLRLYLGEGIFDFSGFLTNILVLLFSVYLASFHQINCLTVSLSLKSTVPIIRCTLHDRRYPS